MDSFQQTIFKLKNYWSERGAIITEPYDIEVGAGTMAPETFLRVLGPKPYRVAYVQPSRRPADGRYGENPNRLYKHQQLQVILKPSPDDIMDQYLASLEAIGIDLSKHDIKFEEDNWESPTLGAWGIGWQVMLDGLEITQFTYFQQCGGIDLELVPAELTYGLERLVAFLQVKDSVYDIDWTPGVKYADVRFADELQNSVYNFEMADIEALWKLFGVHEGEARDASGAARHDRHRDAVRGGDHERHLGLARQQAVGVVHDRLTTVGASPPLLEADPRHGGAVDLAGDNEIAHLYSQRRREAAPVQAAS